MEKFKQFLDESGILPYLNGRGDDAPPAYLVGGAVRDALQDLIVADLDFILPEDPTDCAKGMAHIFKGTWFMLDETRNQSRVVIDIAGKRVECDFAPFRAPSLEDDLRRRDFTMNALAWPCDATSFKGRVIDPLGGLKDIENRQLRACNDHAFLEDPLRTIKGVRHATCLNLSIEDKTLNLLKAAVSNIDQIAPERIRAELAKILSSDKASEGFNLLKESGLLIEIFGNPTQTDGFSLALHQLERFEKLFSEACSSGSDCLQLTLNRNFEEFLQLSGVLNLSMFCRSYKPIALENVLRALRFSNRTVSFVASMQVFNVEECVSRLNNLPPTSRGQARWVANLGPEPIGILYLLKTEMSRLQLDLSVIDQLADNFFQHSEQGKLADLIDGNWMQTTYQLNPGPLVGRLLELVEKAELNGDVTTTQDARKWLWANQKTIDKILLEKL